MRSIKFKGILFVFVLFLIGSGNVFAQTAPGELTEHSDISSEIGPGQIHRYSVALEKDRFAFINVMQIGIDLEIAVFDPKGKKIAEFDSPNGSNGPEYVSIISETSGIFVLEVKPLGNDAKPGKYEIRIEKIEPQTGSRASEARTGVRPSLHKVRTRTLA